MKLLTLNCHSWQEKDQLEKIKIIANEIKEKSYDVIALQEVSQLVSAKNIDGKIKEDNFAIVLLNELSKLGVKDYKMFWDFSHIGFDIYEEGIAILTKHEIKEKKSFFISKNKDQNYWKTRKIIGTTINVNGKLMDFYCCHLGWWHDKEESFKSQVDSLLKQVKFDKLTFFMGDFNNNALIRNEGYDYLRNKGLYDTFDLAQVKDEGITLKGEIDGWKDNLKDMRIDLVLTNEKIDVKSSKVIFNGINKTIVSDHYGVEIKI